MNPRYRWISSLKRQGTRPDIDAFLDEIEAVCRRHGLSISHEDGHGAFEIEDLSEVNIDWLHRATDNRP